MAPLFETLDTPLPSHIRVAIGFSSAGGYTVKTARKWLESFGAPLCPIDGHGAMRHDPLDDDGDVRCRDGPFPDPSPQCIQV